MRKKSRISKMIRPLFLVPAVSVMFTGMIPFAVSNVQAAEPSGIDYGEGEEYKGGDSTPVIPEGDIKALVVRLSYDDHPADTENEYFISDDEFKIIFDGYEEGELKERYKDHPYGCVNDFVRRTSYGRQSLTLGKVIDIAMDNTQQSYYEGTDYGPYGDLEEIEDIIESEEFKEKLFEQVNVSDYDSNGDGEIDALYVFDMAPDAGAENSFLGFYDDNESQPDEDLRYIYFPAELKDRASLVEVVIHETGHMIWNLPDLYGRTGFMLGTDINTAGNLMGSSNNEAGDLDAFSKYHIGWVTEENITRLDINDIIESDRTICLEPYDTDTLSGKVLAIIDCGEDFSIAAEYVSGSNNNRSPILDESPYGFRFYEINKYKGDHISELYDTDETNIFADGEKIFNLFGTNIDVTVITTQGIPSLKLSSGSDSLRKGLTKMVVKSKNVIERGEGEERLDLLDLFRYGDNNAAIMMRDGNNEVKICVLENGAIIREYPVDLSEITDAGIYRASVINLNDGTFAVVFNYYEEEESFVVKMDKEGKIISYTVDFPGSYDDHIIAGDKLHLFGTYHFGSGAVTNIYSVVDLSDMSVSDSGEYEYYGFAGGGILDKDRYYVVKDGSCIIYDNNGNELAVLENEFDYKNVVVCAEGDGFVSVQKRKNGNYYDFDMVKYDSEGKKLSSELLKEVKDGADEEDIVFRDLVSYMSLPKSEDSLQKTEWGWFMTMSGDCYFIYDNGEMEYFGKDCISEEGYWDWSWRSVYLDNGTAVLKGVSNENIVLYEIVAPDLKNDPADNTEGSGTTGDPNDNNTREETENNENSQDNGGAASDGTPGEDSGPEGREEGKDEDPAENVNVYATSSADSDKEKGPASDNSGCEEETKEIGNRSASAIKASGGNIVKAASAPVTGDRDLSALYLTVAASSAVGMAGAAAALSRIRKKRR